MSEVGQFLGFDKAMPVLQTATKGVEKAVVAADPATPINALLDQEKKRKEQEMIDASNIARRPTATTPGAGFRAQTNFTGGNLGTDDGAGRKTLLGL